MIWRDCEKPLVEIHCLAVVAMISRDCWADFRKVPVDCARACRVRDWDGSLMAVCCLEMVVNTWMGWRVIRDIVHCRVASARIPRDCLADLMNVPVDVVRV